MSVLLPGAAQTELHNQVDDHCERVAADIKECQQFLLDCCRGTGPEGNRLTEGWANRLSTILSQYHSFIVPALEVSEIVAAMKANPEQVAKLAKLVDRGIITHGEAAEAVREINNTAS